MPEPYKRPLMHVMPPCDVLGPGSPSNHPFFWMHFSFYNPYNS